MQRQWWWWWLWCCRSWRCCSCCCSCCCCRCYWIFLYHRRDTGLWYRLPAWCSYSCTLTARLVCWSRTHTYTHAHTHTHARTHRRPSRSTRLVGRFNVARARPPCLWFPGPLPPALAYTRVHTNSTHAHARARTHGLVARPPPDNWWLNKLLAARLTD